MSGYIQNIRKKVGHDPVIQCGASIIAVNSAGELLLQLRADCELWGYSGGSVELYEDTKAAAVREFFEETGLTARTLELFGVFSGKDMGYVYPNGDQVSNIDIVYLCRDYYGTPAPQKEEVVKLQYFPLNEIPKNIFPPNIPAIAEYLKIYGVC